MITKFFEYKLADVMKLKGAEKSDLDIWEGFNDNAPLLDKVYLEDYDITLDIVWNDREDHRILDRIKRSTDINSTKHLNDILEQSLKQIIPSQVGKEIDRSGNYALRLDENLFYFIININYGQLLYTKNARIKVITILNTSADMRRVYKKIFIDDSDFY